jgi:hypothetical protein
MQEELQEMDDEDGITFDDWVRERTKELNTLTRDNPYNIRLWLQFVEFQDRAVIDSKRNLAPVCHCSSCFPQFVSSLLVVPV